jgi:alkylation response protein AidB-like acyl-CoA dehydrogenase
VEKVGSLRCLLLSSQLSYDIAERIFQGTPGLTTAAIKNKVALRASSTGSIYLDNVELRPDGILPKSSGLGSAFSCLNNAR